MLSVHVIRLSVAINLEKCMLKLVSGNVKSTKARLSKKLEQLHENDPKAYWKLLEDLKSEM